MRIKSFVFRSLQIVATAGLAAILVSPSAAEAGLFRRGECPAGVVYLNEVTIRNPKDVNGEEVRADYLNKLKISLLKSGISLADAADDLGENGVSMQVEVRAWTDRNSSSNRATLSLAASVRVRDGERRLWSGEVSPGSLSKLMHMKHADPENLAKRTTEAFMEACRSGWENSD